MAFTLYELQQQLGGKISGAKEIKISGVAALENAQPGEISFVETRSHFAQAQKSRASALVVDMNFPQVPNKSLLRIDDPRYGFVQIMKLFERKPRLQPGIHPSAIVAEHGVVIGQDVSVAECTVIREHVSIGQGSQIESGVHLGEGVKVGEHCWIGPNVVLMHGVQIGNRVTIHGGSVIGGDGFGYVWADERHHKIPQLGTVKIDDDVEIGCNVCIDRATFGVTRIRCRTKIDNQVQIGHNNDIGEDGIIVSQVGLSGSVTTGKRVTLAGQVGVADHVTIGDRATVGAASGVTKDIKPDKIVWGIPARPRHKVLRELASLSHIPGLLRQVRELSERLSWVEKKAKQR